ncbi:MAG: murein biosynthesis integral membrane protein MurJ [Clostridia bacterium]|nr:murein biosynthesis integral membrane protein MurJ [Clostridia bacterium]
MARGQRVFRTTMLVTVVIILSKVSGFIRDMILANYFGTGMANDAYVSAYSLFYLPVLLFNSCISATLIPLYVQEREQQSLRHSNHFASNTINLFALAAIVISALFFLLARPLVRLIYVGFDPGKTAMTVDLVRIMLLSLVFNITSISLASLLNASDRYVAAQLTGFPLNLCVIVAAVVFSARYGILAVGWGVFAANILQFLILIPFLKGWFTWTPVLDFSDRRFHRLLTLAGPAMLSMGVSELNHMIDHALASGLNPGDISAMSYAYRLITFLLGVLMVPLTTIMFSKLSRLAAGHDDKGMLEVLRRCILVIALVALPIVAVAVVMSVDVIKFAYMRGRFDMHSVEVTAAILVCYVVGVPAFGLRDFLSRMFHALQDTKTPFRVSCLVVALNIVLNLILRRIIGARGLALATSIAGTTGMCTMLILLKKRFGRLGLGAALPDLLRIVASALICMGVCALMNRALPPAFGTGRVFLRLALCAAASLTAYALSCFALRVRTLRVFAGEVLRRRGR